MHMPRNGKPRGDVGMGEKCACPANSRLYVATASASGTLVPFGRLDRFCTGNGAVVYEFSYLDNAHSLEGFRPLICFPDVRRIYHSTHLFPFFENRLMRRDRADYGGFVRGLGLDRDTDPFEVLVRSGGRRQTDAFVLLPGNG